MRQNECKRTASRRKFGKGWRVMGIPGQPRFLFVFGLDDEIRPSRWQGDRLFDGR